MNKSRMAFRGLGGEPDDNVPCECGSCGWQGKIEDTIRREVNSDAQSWRSLGGRQGFEYGCPKCKWIVHRYYWKVS